MLKADLGDILYIIIFVVIMLGGVIEKAVKARRQQPLPPPAPQPSYESSEDETASAPPPRPQTLEELMRQIMQTADEPPPPSPEPYADEAQSLETIPEEPVRRSYYQPLIIAPPATSPITPGAEEHPDFAFDFRQAVIASEILNRKY